MISFCFELIMLKWRNVYINIYRDLRLIVKRYVLFDLLVVSSVSWDIVSFGFVTPFQIIAND